jgi:hypothetical protein
MKTVIEFVICLFFAAALAILGLYFLVVPASANDIIPRGLGHSSGTMHWYESGCCSKQDCEPVEAGAIIETPQGYKIRYLTSPRPGHPNGFVAEGLIPYSSSSVRPSRDALEHVCSNPTRGICVYLPFGS